tara:strand:- start:10940 stop:12457 length:1518 start_codon:yes stop_codon:yes gene_type:complete
MMLSMRGFAQHEKQWEQYVSIEENDTEKEIIYKAAHLVPSDRQMAWQELEFTCFLSFGINTFTDREWGTRDYTPAMFNPSTVDARQWCRVAKEAGMKLMLLVSKHHDGFCLWPSKKTDFTVASSPWKDGKGDVMKELADACREYGLKLGVYLSPWDMHEPTYGSEAYNDFFVGQLTELLTNYGPIAEVWFDGASGEGPNGKKQEYDWDRYYHTIRKLQPEAVIAVMGPDVRWVGTETGYGRETEWSVVPVNTSEQSRIAGNSQQQEGSGTFIPEGNRMEQDLGSRKKLLGAPGLIWYPSEVDVSIRPGWFYHPREDSLVKTPEKLVDIYYSSVGMNSLLLLNLPPDRRGVIHENDIRSVMGMRRILDETFSENIAVHAKLDATNTGIGFSPDKMVDGDTRTYWAASPGITSAIIEINLKSIRSFDRLLLQEDIRNGQRIESFTIEYFDGFNWKRITEATTVGYKRLLRFETVKGSRIRVNILSSRDRPEISEIGVFMSSKDDIMP